MKKFLALLFVCAGLTAMAVTPHSMKTANLSAKQSVQKLSKVNNMATELTRPVMTKTPISQMPNGGFQQFAKKHDLKKNSLRNRAPRRLDATNLAQDWMVANVEFKQVDGAWTPYYYAGGSTTWTEDTFVERLNVSVFDINNAFVLADPDGDETTYGWGYYFPIYFEAWYDYELGFIEGGAQAAYFVNQVRKSGTTSTTTYTETYWYPFIVDSAYYVGASDTIADMVMFMGLDDSGVLYSDEAFGLMNAYVHYDVTYNNRTGAVTREVFVDSVMVQGGLWGSNYFITPNATHEYLVARDSGSETEAGNTIYTIDASANTLTDGIFVYQEEACDTIFLWNMWGLAYRDITMSLDYEGNMNFPWQAVHEEDVDSWNEQYADYGFNFYSTYFNFNCNFDFDADTIINDGTAWDDTPVQLNEERNKITWGGNEIYDVLTRPDYEGYYFMGIGYLPFLNNSITLAEGLAFTLPEKPASQWRPGDVNHDTFVDVADVSLMIKVALGQEVDVFYWEEADLDDDPSSVDVGDVSIVISIALGKE